MLLTSSVWDWMSASVFDAAAGLSSAHKNGAPPRQDQNDSRVALFDDLLASRGVKESFYSLPALGGELSIESFAVDSSCHRVSVHCGGVFHRERAVRSLALDGEADLIARNGSLKQGVSARSAERALDCGRILLDGQRLRHGSIATFRGHLPSSGDVGGRLGRNDRSAQH